ncbi:MAG: response regulator [Pseudobdellovibrio sp.]
MPSIFKNSLGKKSILVIEDDPELSEVTCAALANAGYGVHAADNVADAIKKLENQKFHLIIVDLFLGAHSGEKIINIIRKDLFGLNIKSPILVCSGYFRQNILDNIKNHIDDAIVKPFTVEDLVAKAEYWTNQLSSKDNSKIRMQANSRPKILIIEDDQEFADNIFNYLSQLSYSPVISNSLVDGKIKLSLQKFDFILIDRHLKTRESSEIIASLNTDVDQINYKTPVVAMTGDLSEDFIAFLRENVEGFIRKPFELSELPRLINSILGLNSN